MINIIFLVLACIFAGYCRGATDELNVPGEDTSVALLLGQGINTVDGLVKGFCVELEELQTQSNQTTGQYTEFRMLEIISESSLRENLNISAAGVLKSSVFFKLDSRFRFASSVNKNTSSRYLLVHVRVANQVELAKGFTFKQNAIDLLETGRMEDFVDFCGNEFVYGRRTGGELFALFEFELSTRNEEQLFDLAIKASGLSAFKWQASGGVKREVSFFEKFGRSQVKIFSIGGMGKLPQVDNLSEFGEEFDEFIATLKKRSVTLELITKDYSGVEPINLVLNSKFLLKQNQIIQQLARNRDYAVEMLNTIVYIKRNSQNFIDINHKDLNQKEREVKEFININNKHVVSCFADIYAGCQIPDAIMPVLEMPMKKKSGSTGCVEGYYWHEQRKKCCRQHKVAHCQLENKQGDCDLYALENILHCVERE